MARKTRSVARKSNSHIPVWDGKDWGIKIPQNSYGLPVGETTFNGLAKQVQLNGRDLQGKSMRGLLRFLTYELKPTASEWLKHYGVQDAPKHFFTTKGGGAKSNAGKKQTKSASNPFEALSKDQLVDLLVEALKRK